MTPLPRLALLSLLIGLCQLQFAHATTHNWTSGQHPDWNTKENWLNGIPDTSSELAVFNGSGSQNDVTFAADVDSSATASGMNGILVQNDQASALSISNSGAAGLVFRLATSAGIAIEPNAGAFSMDTTGSAFFLSLTGVDTISTFQNDSANTATLGDKITIQNRSTQSPILRFAGSGNWQVDSLITGALPIVKDGAGTLTLSNLNTYTGGTTVNKGILSLTAGAVGAGRIRGTLNIETGGEVQINQWALGNSNTAAQNVNAINLNGGILNNVDTANNGGTFAATINMTGGGIKGSSCVIAAGTGGHTILNTLPSASAATISSGFQMRANGGSVGGIMDFNVADGAVATDLMVSGTLTQDGANTQSITKTGAGTMVLSGTNSYNGTTTITAGKLLINGNSSAATGTTTVAGGATLGGTGTMGGAVNVSGTLAPGDGIQSLVSGMTTFIGKSILAVELDSNAMLGTEADLLVVKGDLKLNGPVELRLTDTADSPIAFPMGKVFSLVNYTGTLQNGGRNGFTAKGKLLANGAKFTVGPNTWKITYNSGSGGDNFTEDQVKGRFINITTVPADVSLGSFIKFAIITMAVAGLIALGVLGVFLMRRAAAKPA